MTELKAPFPYFGGKRGVAKEVWKRLGTPKQYIEPFLGSAAVLLAAPKTASLEVVGDVNGYIANFWRAAKYQPAEVANWCDYPVSHIDLGARHKWLLEKHAVLADALHDPEWHGDAQIAGWWLWGQCAWIGSGWCEKIPHVSNAGLGIQASGQIPHVSDAGMLTTGGGAALSALSKIAKRLERVRVIHGDWSRCLNHHYGGKKTAVFLDPPYMGFENLYQESTPIAHDVAEWAREHEHLRIALCGHAGEHEMPGWDQFAWSRSSNTYGSKTTKDAEVIWYSPACLSRERNSLFDFKETA